MDHRILTCGASSKQAIAAPSVQHLLYFMNTQWLQAVRALADTAGVQAVPAAKSLVKHDTPFPRTAFTMRGGSVLYNRAVHPAINVAKVRLAACLLFCQISLHILAVEA
jgi:hypothetical protein